MTDTELIELARQTRQKQRQYFASRNQTVLAECKDLERRLDAEFARRKVAAEAARQPTLF